MQQHKHISFLFTNIVNLFRYKKLGLLFIVLFLMCMFRQGMWAVDLELNRDYIVFNKFPAWQVIVNDDLRQAPPLLLAADEHIVGNISLARAHGLLQFIQGREAEATAVWQAAGLSPAEVTAVQGLYAESINQPQVAIAWYKHAIELDPKLASAWRTVGELHQQQGELIAAKAAYEQAFSLGDADSADLLAKLWRDEGDHGMAIEIWQSALEMFPDDPDRLRWWQGLTNSLRATSQWEAGVEEVENALQEYPEDAWLYVEKGAIIYGSSADTVRAMDALNKAIALDDTIVAAYSAAAGIMAVERQYAAAYDWYTEAIKRNPQNASWHVARGHMARADGNLPLARDTFLTAVDRFPNFAPAYFGLATVYQQLDQKDDAVAAVNQALLVSETKEAQNYFLAAEIYEWGGRLDEAVAIYEQLLMIEPENDRARQAIQRLQNR